MTDDLRDQLLNAPEVHSDQAAPENNDSAGRDDVPPFDPTLGEIFPGSPVTALGIYGDTNFYLDVRGQLRGIDGHTKDKMLSIYGGRLPLLAREFPTFNRNGDPTGEFKQSQLAAAMMSACDACGVWSPVGRVRGSGCWTDEDGNLVVHAGDQVLVDGEWRQPGIYGRKVYAADNPAPRPAPKAPRKDPAKAALEILETWNWCRPDLDPQLLLGVICAQMIGGALDWRPVTWITGDKSTGKSTLQKFLRYIHGGEEGLKQASDATEAGIRSVVGYSSLPVAIDELEPSVDPKDQKAANIIKLARIAASGDQIFRGSSDQKGFQQNAYSCFLFSSIIVPDMPSQDRSRLILLDLDPLDPTVQKLSLQPRTVRGMGAALRYLLVERWQSWEQRLERWCQVLIDHDFERRAADNYGTVLALADMVLSEDLPREDMLNSWAKKVAKYIERDKDEVGTNAADMLQHLLGQPYDVYRKGELFTVAQWVMAAAKLPGAPHALFSASDMPGDQTAKAKEANAKLAKVGLRVRGEKEQARLFIANKQIPALAKLFENSLWKAGGWAQAARRLPDATPVPQPLTLAGMQSRGFFVPIRSISGLLSQNYEPGAMDDLPRQIDADLRDFDF